MEVSKDLIEKIKKLSLEKEGKEISEQEAYESASNFTGFVGTGGEVELNLEPESDELFQNEYENAIFVTTGKLTWESYGKGKKYCPTDFIEHIAADKKLSGQDIIFGTKPLELLIPYIKVLTKRSGLVLEPFGGSGSTLIASLKLGRVCRIMEKSPVYTEVIIKRWEKQTGKKAVKLN